MRAESLSVPAAQISSLKCGGVLKKAFIPSFISDLEGCEEIFDGETGHILGGITNTLVLSSGVDEPVVLTENLRGFTVNNDEIAAYAGERVSFLATLAKSYGLSGLESLCNIPGTIGGAVMGNAGCFGAEISDLICGVDVLKLDTGETEYLSKDEIAFGYRYSNLRVGRDFIYKVHLRLFPSSPDRIVAKMEDVRKKRLESQPKLPSLGSVFKKCGDKSAGWYIEKAGLKGYRYGGMEFSELHANFIVNKGGSAEDYLFLVRLAEKKVYETFGIELSREVKIIGEEDGIGGSQTRYC